MNGRAVFGLVFLALWIGPTLARADEIRLKDGTKISGSIVGFENDSFKVETEYGFAFIRKDKVADIVISAPKKEPESKAKTTPPVAPPAAAAPEPVPGIATELAPVTPAMPKMAVAKHTSVAGPTLPAAKKGTEPQKPASGSDCPKGAICDGGMPHQGTLPHPSVSPVYIEPPELQDEIQGNLYINFTYGFQMYKPPSWDLIPDARKALPYAVAALGTSDETTLLVIGRESARDSLDAQAAASGKALNEVYENYRLISSRRVTIAGLPAIEQRSRGTADGHDWSIELVTFLRGNDGFTLLGMTWAESDLIQVQENVIAKTMNSLTFAPQ